MAPILDCCFGDSTRGFYGSLDKSVKTIDFNTSQEEILGHHDDAVRCVFYDKVNDTVLTGSWDKSVRVWDCRTKSMVTKVDHPDKVYTMDGTDHRLVVGTKGRHVWIWDQRNMKVVEQRRESSLKHQTRCIKTFPNGLGYALSSIEGRVAVEYFDTNPEAQKQKFAFKCHREKVDNQNVIYPVTALAFHKQHGSFASGGCDGKVNIWDPINKKRLCQFPKQETSIASISFNGEGNLMAVASSYMFEEGEKDHPPDSIKINFITEEMVKSKQK